MKSVFFLCALTAAISITAGETRAPTPQESFGSVHTVSDIQICLASKLSDLGAATTSVPLGPMTLSYGNGRGFIIVTITDQGDLRSVTVSATRKLKPARQDAIRSCMV